MQSSGLGIMDYFVNSLVLQCVSTDDVGLGNFMRRNRTESDQTFNSMIFFQSKKCCCPFYLVMAESVSYLAKVNGDTCVCLAYISIIDEAMAIAE